MAKTKKSYRRTKRVYRRKPRLHKKRQTTKRKAGCSPETATKLAVAASVLALARPSRKGRPDVGCNPMYEYAQDHRSPQERRSPKANVMNRSLRPSIIDPKNLSEIYHRRLKEAYRRDTKINVPLVPTPVRYPDLLNKKER